MWYFKGTENIIIFFDLLFKDYGCNFEKHQISLGGAPVEVIPGTREERIYNAAYNMYKEKKYTVINDKIKSLLIDKNGKPVTVKKKK